MLITFETDDGSIMAINPDRIDGLLWDEGNNRTVIYMSGSDSPFYIYKPVEEVVNIINAVTE